MGQETEKMGATQGLGVGKAEAHLGILYESLAEDWFAHARNQTIQGLTMSSDYRSERETEILEIKQCWEVVSAQFQHRHVVETQKGHNLRTKDHTLE